MALSELLRSTTIETLLSTRQRKDAGLVCMPEQCSVGDALARLLAEGLRSAPVVAAGTAAAPAGGGIPADSMRGFVEAAAVIDELMKGAARAAAGKRQPGSGPGRGQRAGWLAGASAAQQHTTRAQRRAPRRGPVVLRDTASAATCGLIRHSAVHERPSLITGLHEVSWPPSPAELEEAGARLCALPLSQLLRPPPAPAAGVRAPSSCPWPAVDAQASVVDAMGAFVASHAQHLLVTGAGDAKNIVSVVSQSDVVRWGRGAS